MKQLFLIMLLSCSMLATAASQIPVAITQPIPLTNIRGFNHYPAIVQTLIKNAYQLSTKNLTYLYGSANPRNGGMDCSGTVYYLLQMMQLKDIPRDAVGMYNWAKAKGRLYKVTTMDFKSKEFDALQPGNLLFWSGTYTSKKNPAITHVMIYLGKNTSGQPLMFGASDGRMYQHKKIWGVSVFDFELPNGKTTAKFVGYSCIPQLTC